MQKTVQKTVQICRAVRSCVGMQPDAGAEEEAMMPLAIAHEMYEVEMAEGSLFDEALPSSRADAHLVRLKEALLLYVNAKYSDRVTFTSIEGKLAKVGVGKRAVDGAWSLIRAALAEASLSSDMEHAAVATSLIKSLSYVPRVCDAPRLAQAATDFKSQSLHSSAAVHARTVPATVHVPALAPAAPVQTWLLSQSPLGQMQVMPPPAQTTLPLSQPVDLMVAPPAPLPPRTGPPPLQAPSAVPGRSPGNICRLS